MSNYLKLGATANWYKVLFISSLVGLIWNAAYQIEVKHSIEVLHQGISPTDPVACTLVEIQDAEGQPEAFYMDVESVVCGDQHCRIDLVRIYWNPFGQFSNLVLPQGVFLEKAAGKNFTDVDYKKLEGILENENSTLQDVYKNEIVNTVGSEGVDAMTGATVLLDTSAYVEGAVWTCYSLWHWVHGDTKQLIRNITGNAYPISKLQKLIGENENQDFALEQLIRRQDFSITTAELILKTIEKNPSLLQQSIVYWELAPRPIFTHAMSNLIVISKSKNRLIGFNAILNTQHNLSPSFFKDLNLPLAQLNYQEINLFLKILEKNKMVSEAMMNELVSLLDSEDFLIARCVYWFLNDQSLSEWQQHQLEKFYNIWKERL
ncbi:MAG: hypothetical protein AAF573_12525 [Bacteroidota bacterium]